VTVAFRLVKREPGFAPSRSVGSPFLGGYAGYIFPPHFRGSSDEHVHMLDCNRAMDERRFRALAALCRKVEDENLLDTDDDCVTVVVKMGR